MPCRRRGISVIEVLLAIAATALVTLLSVPVFGSLRLTANQRGSVDNLRQLAVANASFNADNNDLIASYDWKFSFPTQWKGKHVPARPFDLGNGLKHYPTDNHEASQAQQCFILRYVTGRDEHHAKPITLDFNVMPQRRFLYLTMLPYLGGTLPNPAAASPLDQHLLEWRDDPYDYGALPGGDSTTAGRQTWQREQVLNRWPYASSYQATVYAWSPDTPVGGMRSLPMVPAGDGTRIGINIPSECTVQRPMTDVTHPARKAFLFEEFDFTAGKGANGNHYTNADATVAVQFFDGSVRRIITRNANPGWDPSRPGDKTASASIRYAPIDTRYFPDDTGLATPNAGYYKWTRDGLRGIDVPQGTP